MKQPIKHFNPCKDNEINYLHLKPNPSFRKEIADYNLAPLPNFFTDSNASVTDSPRRYEGFIFYCFGGFFFFQEFFFRWRILSLTADDFSTQGYLILLGPKSGMENKYKNLRAKFYKQFFALL